MSGAEKGALTFFAGLIIVYHLMRWPVPGVLIALGLIVDALIKAAPRCDFARSSKIKVRPPIGPKCCAACQLQIKPPGIQPPRN